MNAPTHIDRAGNIDLAALLVVVILFYAITCLLVTAARCIAPRQPFFYNPPAPLPRINAIRAIRAAHAPHAPHAPHPYQRIRPLHQPRPGF